MAEKIIQQIIRVKNLKKKMLKLEGSSGDQSLGVDLIELARIKFMVEVNKLILSQKFNSIVQFEIDIVDATLFTFR